MTYRLCVIILLLAGLVQPLAAQDSAKDSAQDDKSATEGKANAKEADASANPMGSSFGDLNFEKVVAKNIFYDPEGGVNLEGSVFFKSDQITLSCEHLTKGAESKVLTAIGSPVHVEQGDEFKADCQRLTYDMDKKSYKLEGSPVIYQKQKNQTTKTTGDIITIVMKESGRPSVSISMLPNSNRMPTIEVLDAKGNSLANKKKPAAKPAKKIEKDNTEIIKLPEMGQ